MNAKIPQFKSQSRWQVINNNGLKVETGESTLF
jgi:cell division septal protein FtsQ